MNADVLAAFTDHSRQGRQPSAHPALAFADPGRKLGRRQQVIEIDGLGTHRPQPKWSAIVLGWRRLLASAVRHDAIQLQRLKPLVPRRLRRVHQVWSFRAAFLELASRPQSRVQQPSRVAAAKRNNFFCVPSSPWNEAPGRRPSETEADCHCPMADMNHDGRGILGATPRADHLPGQQPPTAASTPSSAGASKRRGSRRTAFRLALTVWLLQLWADVVALEVQTGAHRRPAGWRSVPLSSWLGYDSRLSYVDAA